MFIVVLTKVVVKIYIIFVIVIVYRTTYVLHMYHQCVVGSYSIDRASSSSDIVQSKANLGWSNIFSSVSVKNSHSHHLRQFNQLIPDQNWIVHSKKGKNLIPSLAEPWKQLASIYQFLIDTEDPSTSSIYFSSCVLKWWS